MLPRFESLFYITMFNLACILIAWQRTRHWRHTRITPLHFLSMIEVFIALVFFSNVAFLLRTIGGWRYSVTWSVPILTLFLGLAFVFNAWAYAAYGEMINDLFNQRKRRVSQVFAGVATLLTVAFVSGAIFELGLIENESGVYDYGILYYAAFIGFYIPILIWGLKKMWALKEGRLDPGLRQLINKLLLFNATIFPIFLFGLLDAFTGNALFAAVGQLFIPLGCFALVRITVTY